MNFWKAEETHMTYKKIITDGFIIATGAVVPWFSAEKLLCFYDYGKERYFEFWTNRFVQKDTSLSSTIKKIHITNFLTHLKKEKTKTESANLSTKQLSASYKSWGRDIPIAEILQNGLFPTNILFDEDYTFKPDKATLIEKLKEILKSGDLTLLVPIPDEEKN